MRDVLAAAAGAVQVVARGAVARERAADRYLSVVRELAADGAIGIVETSSMVAMPTVCARSSR